MSKRLTPVILYVLLSLLVFLSPLSTLSTQADAMDREEVSADKYWTIEFNQELDFRTVNPENIYVTNDKNEKLDTILLWLDETKKKVTVRNSVLYEEGKHYILYVSTKVKGIKGNALKEEITKPFTITSNEEGNGSGQEEFLSNVTGTVTKSNGTYQYEIKGEAATDVAFIEVGLNKDEKIPLAERTFSFKAAKSAYYPNTYIMAYDKNGVFLGIHVINEWKEVVLTPSPIPNQSLDLPESKEEIKQRWQTLQPSFIGSPYQVWPVTSAPYGKGMLEGEAIQDGVNMTNFVRYLVGLPDDIQADPEFNELAQYGSVILAANGYLSHHPPKPDEMEQDFYQNGYEATSSGNLFSVSGLYGEWMSQKLGISLGSNVSTSVFAYMSDSDTNNLDRVGHRRWVLSPFLKYTGFGLAGNSQGYEYSVMHVFDDGNRGMVEYDYTTWPSATYFPTQFFAGTDAWSIQLNRDKYGQLQLEDVKVTLTRLSDQRVWTFDSSHNTITSKGRYFNVDNSNMGWTSSVIFRPEGIDQYQDGDEFSVHVTGLKDKNSQPIELQYNVTFFDLTR